MAPSYYPTSLPPPPPSFPSPSTPTPQNHHPTWPHHSPTATPRAIPSSTTARHHSQSYTEKSDRTLPPNPPLSPYPPQPKPSAGNSARVKMPDLAARPMHQGGMALYDMSGPADWVAANSVSGHEEGFGTQYESRDTPDTLRSKRFIPSSSSSATVAATNTAVALRSKRFIPSSTHTTPSHHTHLSPSSPPMPTTPEVKKTVRFTESVQERDGRREERMKADGKRIERLVCEGCGGKSVEWSVGGKGYCEGCFREARKRRGGR